MDPWSIRWRFWGELPSGGLQKGGAVHIVTWRPGL